MGAFDRVREQWVDDDHESLAEVCVGGEQHVEAAVVDAREVSEIEQYRVSLVGIDALTLLFELVCARRVELPGDDEGQAARVVSALDYEPGGRRAAWAASSTARVSERSPDSA